MAGPWGALNCHFRVICPQPGQDGAGGCSEPCPPRRSWSKTHLFILVLNFSKRNAKWHNLPEASALRLPSPSCGAAEPSRVRLLSKLLNGNSWHGCLSPAAWAKPPPRAVAETWAFMQKTGVRWGIGSLRVRPSALGAICGLSRSGAQWAEHLGENSLGFGSTGSDHSSHRGSRSAPSTRVPHTWPESTGGQSGQHPCVRRDTAFCTESVSGK